MSEILEVFTDGGSRGNPGKSACAFVVLKDGEVIAKDSKYLGIITNNQAEYGGLLLFFEWAIKNPKTTSNIKELNIFMDSELVVRQMRGQYRIKDTKLIELASKVKKNINSLAIQVVFKSVLRSKNTIADSLVNECLDGHN